MSLWVGKKLAVAPIKDHARKGLMKHVQWDHHGSPKASNIPVIRQIIINSVNAALETC